MCLFHSGCPLFPIALLRRRCGPFASFLVCGWRRPARAAIPASLEMSTCHVYYCGLSVHCRFYRRRTTFADRNLDHHIESSVNRSIGRTPKGGRVPLVPSQRVVLRSSPPHASFLFSLPALLRVRQRQEPVLQCHHLRR